MVGKKYQVLVYKHSAIGKKEQLEIDLIYYILN